MSSSENLVEWSDRYVLHVPSIDEQHKRLFDLMNVLHSAISFGKTREVLSYALSELVLYTHSHFQYEEEAMAKYGYPGLTMHRIEHQHLIRQVEGYVQMYLDQTLGISELTPFLKGWLVNHIGRDDNHFAQFIRTKGIVLHD